MNYNHIGSASPSSTRSEDIPLLPRTTYGLPPRSGYPYYPSLPSPQNQPKSALKPALTLDTNYSSRPPPPPTHLPPSHIPLPKNPAAAARLELLRDSVDSIRSPQSYTSSPIQTTFASAGEPTSLAGWTGADVFFEHLGKIRALGSEVGRLHAEMEGVSVGWGGEAKKEGEGEEETEKGKGETKDFDAAAMMFEKRQESIEGIMSKVRPSSHPSSLLLLFASLPRLVLIFISFSLAYFNSWPISLPPYKLFTTSRIPN